MTFYIFYKSVLKKDVAADVQLCPHAVKRVSRLMAPECDADCVTCSKGPSKGH